jgi:hypothetical protein
MMNRSSSTRVLAAVALPALVLAAGCDGGGAQQQTQAVQTTITPPAPPPPPPIASVQDLRLEMNIDERVRLDEIDAPGSETERRAVLAFADAFARGNTNSLRDLLALDDEVVMDQLMASGRWHNADEIEDVWVVTGPNPRRTGLLSSPANLAVLAIFTVNGRLEPTMWYLEDDEFVSGMTPFNITDRMTGADLIDAWHAVIDEEQATGQRLDFDLNLPKQILEQRRPGGGIPSDPTAPPGPQPPSLPGGPSPGGPGPGGPGPGVPL